MIKTFILAAAVFAAATPALAADDSDTATAEVRIDDLDLADPADQRRLDDRVTNAARHLCDSGIRGLAGARLEQRCVALAIESAAQQADRAIALAHTNRRLAQIDLAVAG